jgi:hypothetical protein
MFIKALKIIPYTGGLLCGLFVYILTKKTPNFGYKSMIHLFCLTGGLSNDLLSRAIGFCKKPYAFGKVQGVLGDLTAAEQTKIVGNLRQHGFHVFADRLSDELCEQLLEFATTQPCKMRPMSGQDTAVARLVVYPRSAPQTVRYDFSTQDLLNNPQVQGLLADLSFAAIAQDYLQARPKIDVLSMWWHTAYSDKPDKDAAQFFHFDMDRPKWVKFFIYLTDVSADNGPHVFVQGSHKTAAIPATMLDKGYARLTDEEVETHFGRKNIVEFVAPRGTIIAEDTRGLHKGKHVKQDDRLILQIQFSNSLFGTNYPRARFPANLSEMLDSAKSRFSDLYAIFK